MREGLKLEIVRVRQRIGQDDILHPELPVGLTEREVEVMVVYQPVQVLAATTNPLVDLYGICSDDLTVIDQQGISATFDDDLAGAFD